MNYQELRREIARNIDNQEELLRLVTPENVQTVTECHTGTTEQARDYQPGDSESAYQAGSTVASSLYDPKSAGPNTVDEILEVFHPANIYPAELFRRTSPAVKAAPTNRTEFFQAADEAANQISEDLC